MDWGIYNEREGSCKEKRNKMTKLLILILNKLLSISYMHKS